MELNLKMGDQMISVTFMGHKRIEGAKVIAAPGTEDISMDAHRVVLADALNGDTESIVLDSEGEAIQFVTEFLDPNGYPAGGIYDTKVTGRSFKM